MVHKMYAGIGISNCSAELGVLSSFPISGLTSCGEGFNVGVVDIMRHGGGKYGLHNVR